MKTYLTIVILFSFFVLYGFTDSPEKEQLVIKGFSLGMNKAEVKKVYEQFEKDKVAEYISIENEKYRDLIKLDHELSSMGNKIEIEYDESGKAKNITFQYKTVDILFEASNMEAEEMVKEIENKYNLSKLEYQDLGMVKTWTYINEELKYKITVDDYKNVKLQRID